MFLSMGLDGRFKVALRKESVDRNGAMQIVIIVVSTVALRKESVDRNRNSIKRAICRIKSLSARRAWIEICGGACGKLLALLSLSARRAWIEIFA